MTTFNGVVLDLEMTGLDPKTDKIIEIGALKIRDGKVTDTFETLLSPGRLLSGQTKSVTNITDEMLYGQPDFSSIYKELSEFLEEDVLLGHRILQDYSFLKRAVLNLLPKGSKFERQGVDTLKIARHFLDAGQKKSLPALCAYYGISYKPHRAKNDAWATFQLYERLWQEFGQKEQEQFTPRPLLYQVKRETPIMKKQIEQLERFLREHNLTSPYDLSAMTKNEASRYYDQLKSRVRATAELTGQMKEDRGSDEDEPTS